MDGRGLRVAVAEDNQRLLSDSQRSRIKRMRFDRSYNELHLNDFQYLVDSDIE